MSIFSDSNVFMPTAASLAGGESLSDLVFTQLAKDYDSKNKTMDVQKISPIAASLLDADTKTLINGGLLNQDLSMTLKGWEALKALLFTANKAALVVAAQANIDAKTK